MVKSPMDYFQEQDFSMNDASGQDITLRTRIFEKISRHRRRFGPAGLTPVEGVPMAGLALSAAREAAARAGEDVRPAEPVPSVAPAEGGAACDETTGHGRGVPRLGPSSRSCGRALSGRHASGAGAGDPGGLLRGGRRVCGSHRRRIEVIRYEEPFKLPMAPAYMPGVVNLRGRILPVVRLADLLILEGRRKAAAAAAPEGGKNGLIIICEGRGLQVGLLIDKLHTMFKAGQSDLNWNAEAHLGPSAELLSGLLETGEKLLGIVSVERLVR